MALQRDLREFIASLNSSDVDYLIIGAYALAIHGHPRLTGDLDVFVRATSDNMAKLQKALAEFSSNANAVDVAEFLQPDRMLRIGVEPNQIDILSHIAGVTFEEAWEHRVHQDAGGIQANFIGRREFIRNKKATGRLQDLADAEFIENLGD